MKPSKPRKHHFSFSQRWAVYEGYERFCLYCGDIVQWRDLEVDHILSESLLHDPAKLNALVADYGLGDDFSINSFLNWACSHRWCNRSKADTTLDKSRALHYLLIAGKKAESARRIFNATEKGNRVNKVLAHLRALIESGKISRQEIVDFADAIVRNADVGLNNPVVVCFGLTMEDVYEDFPEGAPESPPYVYDWLENKLITELENQLGCGVAVWESQRTGETLSARIALWDLDYDRLTALQLRWWEILELALHTEIYGEFVESNL